MNEPVTNENILRHVDLGSIFSAVLSIGATIAMLSFTWGVWGQKLENNTSADNEHREQARDSDKDTKKQLEGIKADVGEIKVRQGEFGVAIENIIENQNRIIQGQEELRRTLQK